MVQELLQLYFRPSPGQLGNHLPMVSLRDNVPFAASESAAAPLNAFATLASRIESDA